MPVDPTAAPARDWNERISADCYRPNALAGNFGSMSWDLGPTLAGWLETSDPVAYDGFVDGEAGSNGMAQPFHHAILPLASAADRHTEIRWGLRDFELRFGRRPAGMWLPETAVDLATLRAMADEGITYTVLAPWQVDGIVDTRRPHRIDLGDGRSMVVVLYDGLLSAAVSFEPWATGDADAFVRDRLVSRFARPTDPDDARRDRHGRRAVRPSPAAPRALPGPARRSDRAARTGRTTSSRSSAPSPRPPRSHSPGATARADVVVVPRRPRALERRIARACADGSWKAPLRTALERLAGGIDSVTDELARGLPGLPIRGPLATPMSTS